MPLLVVVEKNEDIAFALRESGKLKVSALSLELNVVQSAEARQPKTEPEAVSQSTSFTVLVSPSPKVRGTW
jgi:hypothetical protein